MNNGKMIYAGIALVVVLLALCVYLNMGGAADVGNANGKATVDPAGNNIPVSVQNPERKSNDSANAEQTANGKGTTVANSSDKAGAQDKVNFPEWRPNIKPESKIEIDKLQDLLDNDETAPEAVKQALSMVRNGDVDQKLAAIEAFRWLGGHDSKKGLVDLIKGGGDLSSRASEALQSLFQADTDNEDASFDGEVWEEAFDALEDPFEREAYMVLLAANPIEDAAPVLIDMWGHYKDDATLSLIREYFEHISLGEIIPDVETAIKWFDDYKTKKAAEDAEIAAEENVVPIKIVE